jgi:hypothetical protein
VLVLAVDWFMGIGRALTNLIGNCVATVAIARWEKDIDVQRANKVLSGQQGYTFQPRKPELRRISRNSESTACRSAGRHDLLSAWSEQ